MAGPTMTAEEFAKVYNDPVARQKAMAEALGMDVQGLIEQAVENVASGDKLGTLMQSQINEILQKRGFFEPLGIRDPYAKSDPRLTRLPMGVPKGMTTSANAPGAKMNGLFHNLGDFAQAMSPKVQEQLFGRQLDSRFQKDASGGPLAESTGSTGGFLVPEDLRTQLMYYVLEDAIWRPRATVIPVSTSVTAVPLIRDTTHADGTVYGGVRGSWTAEAAEVDESQPTFGQMRLTAKKLTLFTAISNELARDNVVGLEQMLSRLFGDATTFFEETAYIQGVGDGMPVGVINADATVTVTPVGGQAAGTIVYANILAMQAQLLPRSWNRAIWIANPAVLPQLGQLAISVGIGGGPVWINWGGGQDNLPTTLLGRPIYFSEHASALGTPGDIILADPSYYVIGDRQAMEMAASPHVRFTSDQTVYRFTERLDGRPWIDSPITQQHGGVARSPFVILGAR